MTMRASISLGKPFANADVDEPLSTAAHAFDVIDAAYHTAHGFPGGVPALSQRMGMIPSTLMSKVALNNTSHHVTLREAVTMQEVTGNVSILQAMAASLGYDIVKSIAAASDDPITLNWQMVAALADMQHSIADAMQHGVSRNSLHRVEVQAAESSSAINNMVAALRAKAPAKTDGQK
jgi:hypothetical protein